jgi:hypothetical protein
MRPQEFNCKDRQTCQALLTTSQGLSNGKPVGEHTQQNVELDTNHLGRPEWIKRPHAKQLKNQTNFSETSESGRKPPQESQETDAES